MATIVPRWEWRTFGASFGEADQRFSTLTPEKVQESDEIYLLSPHTDANVKIRDALMDLKTLERVNAEGLEQWRPVMKATFPLPLDDLREVCAALGVPPLASAEPPSLAALKSGLAAAGVRVVPVHKRRVRYAIDGCMSEVTAVVADGRPVQTVAIESEDADAVLGAVARMSLAGFANVSYPRGLKALLGVDTGKG